MKTLGELAPPVCPECGGSPLIWDPDSGEEVCGKCGLVIAESTIYMGPEWRAFTKSEAESRSRVGRPLSFTIYDRGLTTVITQVGRDGYGRRIPLKSRPQMFRLRRWQRRSQVQSYIDRNLARAMAELDRLADQLHIPPLVQETAAVIYRKALKKGLVRGRSIPDMVVASLYAACRITQTPWTLTEMARHSTIDRKGIARCYRILLRGLNLRVPIPSAQLRVPRIAAKVDVGEKTQRTAVEILREAERLKATVGKNPIGLAAAALYLACVMNDENRTQKVIAAAAGVTEVTIRNLYTKLKEVLELRNLDTPI